MLGGGGVFGDCMDKQLLTDEVLHPWIPPGFSCCTGSGSSGCLADWQSSLYAAPHRPGMCLAPRCSVPKPALHCCPATAQSSLPPTSSPLRSLVLEGLRIHHLSAEPH